MKVLVYSLFGILIFAMATLWSVATFAAPSTSIMSADEQAALNHPWGFSIGLGHGESLYNMENGTRVSFNTLTNVLSYKLNKNYTLSGEVDLLQDAVNSDNNDISGASLSLAHSDIPVAHRFLLLTPSLSSSIPVSQYDHHISLQTSLGASFKTAINPEFLISKKLSVALTLAGIREFNTYYEAQNGAVNMEYIAVQDLRFAWNFTDQFSISIDGAHIDLWDYNGILQEAYSHSEELDFAVNKHWTVAMGHCYGNPLNLFVPVWSADGKNQNFSLIDERYSTVYGQVTLTY